MRFTKYVICLAVFLSAQELYSQVQIPGATAATAANCAQALSARPMGHSKELANAIINNRIEELKELLDDNPYNISYRFVYDLNLFPDSIKSNFESVRLLRGTASTLKPSLNEAQRKEFSDFISTLKPLDANTNDLNKNYILNLLNSSFFISMLELAVVLHGPDSEIVTFLIGLDYYNNESANMYIWSPPQSLNENELSSLLITALEEGNEHLLDILELILPHWSNLLNSRYFRQQIDGGHLNSLDRILEEDVEVSFDALAHAFASKKQEVINVFLKHRNTNTSLIKLNRELKAFRLLWIIYIKNPH